MIPQESMKPVDRRLKHQTRGALLAEEISYLCEATTVPLSYKNPGQVLETRCSQWERLVYEAEFHYLHGHFGRAMACYDQAVGEDAVRLRLCPLAIATAISLGDYEAYGEIERYLKGMIQKHPDSIISAVAELALATASVSALAPCRTPAWLSEGDYSLLPAAMRPDAAYLRAKHLLAVGKYESALNVAQTTLSMTVSDQGFRMHELYLRVCCAIACCCLERTIEAEAHLRTLMETCLPHGFLSPLVETAALMDGMTERMLEKLYPQYRQPMLSQWQRTFNNWLEFHNRFTKHHISTLLTLREHQIVSLVIRRIPYKDIARRHNISEGRLKNILLGVYGKLCVSGREELIHYMTH